MIEIACSADARYLPHVSVLLHSLLTHTRARPIRIWLMHDRDLPAESVARVRKVTDAFDAQLALLPVPESMLEGFPTSKFHRSCWYRIFLPALLPTVDKILYLDCDMVVTADLLELWQTNLQSKLFAAAVNPLVPTLRKVVRDDLGISDFLNYLNSGVLLLNLATMREENTIAALREYAQVHPDNMCPEQDALSVLMPGRWVSLHARWNAQTPLFDMRPSRLPIPKAEILEAVNNPAIVHFNGPFKPWQYLCKHPMRGLYFEHLEKTPWPRKELELATWPYRLMWPLSVSMQYFLMLHVKPLWRTIRRSLRGQPSATRQG